MPEPPALDGSRIRRPTTIAVLGDSFPIVGDPFSATAGSTVRVTNLETQDEPVTTTAGSDGSFTIEARASEGDELRIDAVQRDEHSEPVYVLAETPLAPGPRHDCIELLPEFTLAFSKSPRTQNLVILNGCDEDAVIDNPRARLGLSDFSLESELPVTVAAGESASLSFEFSEDDSGAREDVFFVDIDVGGEALRYPITLFSPAKR